MLNAYEFELTFDMALTLTVTLLTAEVDSDGLIRRFSGGKLMW